MPDTLPSRLGRYVLQSELGRGGFAVVYRARDTNLEMDVALKVLKPAWLDDAKAVHRFLREARQVAPLTHPHIVRIFDVGQEEGRLFIAMELIKGRSLQQLVADEGPLPWAQTLMLLGQAAEALDFAHRHGLVHRDIKPANLILDETRPVDSPHVMLTDFGLVRGAENASLATGLTSGAILGTPEYIAPEVWEGEPATVTSDVYALACVAFYLLTGKVLFGATNPMAVLKRHLQGPAFPENWPTGVPTGTTERLRQALASDPAQRPAGARAFVSGLQANELAAQRQREETRQAELRRQAEADAARHAQEEAAQSQQAKAAQHAREAEPDRLALASQEVARQAQEREAARQAAADAARRAQEEAAQRAKAEQERQASMAAAKTAQRAQEEAAQQATAERERQAADLYAQLEAAVAAEDWSAARSLATRLDALQPRYRDSAHLADAATLGLARAAVAVGEWATVQREATALLARQRDHAEARALQQQARRILAVPPPAWLRPLLIGVLVLIGLVGAWRLWPRSLPSASPAATPAPEVALATATATLTVTPSDTPARPAATRTPTSVLRTPTPRPATNTPTARPAATRTPTSVLRTPTPRPATNTPTARPAATRTPRPVLVATRSDPIAAWLARNDASRFTECSVTSKRGEAWFQCRWSGEDTPPGVSMALVACQGDKSFPTAPYPDCVDIASYSQVRSASNVQAWVHASCRGRSSFIFEQVPCGGSRGFKWGVVVRADNPARTLFVYGPLSLLYEADDPP